MESFNFSEPQQLFQERCVRRPIASTIIRGACWHLLHLVIATFLIIQDMIYHLLSSGVRYDYQLYRPVNLKYLAIVFDTKSVKLTGKIVELLDWLSCIGVQNLILYDSEGILKKSVPVLKRGINSNSIIFCDNDLKDLDTISGRETLSIEVLSYSDNKEAVAKAASYLCANTIHGERPTEDDTRSPFDEADVGRALEAVGCGGPAPDLLLVFGGARCHFGFPAWRLRYTEIVHAGPLESLNYGAILKAFHRFSITRQNYGK